VVGGFELGTDGPTVVLTGVDGSRTSLRAGAYAAGLARRQRARLVVVHVSAGVPFAGLAPGGAAAAAEAGRDLAEDLRRQVREGAEHTGVTAEFVLAQGDPFAELIRVAKQVRAEVIVVGASESAGHRLVGSLAVRLVRAGRWPVTVVP
jgi:nucleotide-binding universal stress UspA family protein